MHCAHIDRELLWEEMPQRPPVMDNAGQYGVKVAGKASGACALQVLVKRQLETGNAAALSPKPGGLLQLSIIKNELLEPDFIGFQILLYLKTNEIRFKKLSK